MYGKSKANKKLIALCCKFISALLKNNNQYLTDAKNK